MNVCQQVKLRANVKYNLLVDCLEGKHWCMDQQALQLFKPCECKKCHREQLQILQESPSLLLFIKLCNKWCSSLLCQLKQYKKPAILSTSSVALIQTIHFVQTWYLSQPESYHSHHYCNNSFTQRTIWYKRHKKLAHSEVKRR